MNRKRRMGIWMGALALAAAPAAQARSTAMDRHEMILEQDEKAETPETQDAAREGIRIKVLSEKFAVPEREVRALREKEKWGWGEISHLLAISYKSGQSVEAVTALRKSGMGWGEIAQQYGFKLGEIKRDLRATDRQIRHQIRIHEQVRQERLERTAPRIARADRRVGRPERLERREFLQERLNDHRANARR